jgi:predicted RNase H-related nuclease YkuK (DUF458 family)
MKEFRTLNKVPIPNIVEYIREYVKSRPNIEILIGCDSQCYGTKFTIYGIVVVLYTPGKGGHVLCTKEEAKFEGNTPVRLLTEVWKSIEMAEFLKENHLPKPKWIDIDLNPDVKFGSNSVLRQAVGMVEGMGYHARCKHNGCMATSAADSLVREGHRKKRKRHAKV